KCGEIEGLFLFMYSMGRHDQIYKATRLFLRVLSLTIIRTLSDSEGVQIAQHPRYKRGRDRG
ncbi:hypothetical protein, partial [Ekhidna sp.]|uniref:hypothetical protein n=1 Tax=Ekhidna sp. TaxID=2608089 RepID=UPI0032980829